MSNPFGYGRKPWKVSTKARKKPWWENMFIHSDTEDHYSKHDACGGPVRTQHLRSVPATVTDETALATAVSEGWVVYCPKCDVQVDEVETIFTTKEK